MTQLKRDEIIKELSRHIFFEKDKLRFSNLDDFVSKKLDDVVSLLLFEEDDQIKESLRWLIRQTCIESGIIPASIQSFYEAKSRGKYPHLTVPATNIRGLTYDTARALFRCAKKNNSKSFIFEIAKSEIAYTKQKPIEYSTVILAAALREGYKGPVFIQGDHFQINAKKYAADPTKEINEIKDLIKEAIEADFYNIDIDASTTVDLSKKTIDEQQFTNYDLTSTLAKYIREIEPKGVTVTVGGEIGEVGGKNSTVEELEAFLNGFSKSLASKMPNSKGLSKISVQTGTTHGGFVLPDGSIAKVKLDFETLRSLSKEAKKWGLSGAVQHGASTLPNEAFDKFPETDTAEIHLATGFQNIVLDSRNLPVALKNRIIEYIHDTFINEKKEGETDEQFVYKTRKKSFGPFKKELYDLPRETKDAISAELEDQFSFLFEKLGVSGSAKFIDETVKPKIVDKKPPKDIAKILSR